MANEADPFRTPPLTSTQAAAAIVKLINGRPTSPRQEEIEPIVGRVATTASTAVTTLSEPQALLLEAVQECVAAEKALNAGVDLPSDQYEAADVRFTDALARVGKLSEQLPPPHSVTDIVLLAQAAWCYADKTNGLIEAADNTEAAQARVVAVVLQLAGISYR